MTFTGMRAVGRAMRWARRQNGVTVDHARLAFQGYDVHVWDDHCGGRVVVGHHATEGPDFTAVAGDKRRDRCPVTAAEALADLAALGLIPAELAEPEVQPQGQATGSDLCRCDWLGVGTPEHLPTAFCRDGGR